MRLKLAPILSTVSGRVGALSFVDAPTGPHARKARYASPLPTPAQLTQRAAYHRVASLWRSLPVAVLAAMNARTNLPAASPLASFFRQNLSTELSFSSPYLLTAHPTLPTPSGLSLVPGGGGGGGSTDISPDADLNLQLSVTGAATHHAAMTDATRQPTAPPLGSYLYAGTPFVLLVDELGFANGPTITAANNVVLWVYGSDMGGPCRSQEYVGGTWTSPHYWNFFAGNAWDSVSLGSGLTQSDIDNFKVRFGLQHFGGPPCVYYNAYLAFDYTAPGGAGYDLEWTDPSLGAGYYAFILARTDPDTTPDPRWQVLTRSAVLADTASFTVPLSPYPTTVQYLLLFYHPASGALSGSAFIEHTP